METALISQGQKENRLVTGQAAAHAIRIHKSKAALKEHKRRQGCHAQGSQHPGKAHGMCLRGISLRGVSCGGAADCGADVFMQAAPDEDGRIDMSRIRKAMKASGVMKGLNERKISEALICESQVTYPEANGRLTLGEFLEIYERVSRGLQRAARQRKISAKTPQLSVPKEWLTLKPLQKLYASACIHGATRRSMRTAAKSEAGMTRHQWSRLCSHTRIVCPAGPVASEAIDLAFVVSVQRNKQQRLSWQMFCQALAHLSSDVGYNVVELMLRCCDPA